MRIILSGGGTGGHVYPVLTVVEAAKALWAQHASDEPLTFLYAGTEDGVEAQLAQRANIDFAPIPAGQIRILNPLKLARNAWRMMRGTREARSLLTRWQPDAVFVTGGYVCGPIVWASKHTQTRVLIYLPDIQPGMGVRRLAPYATDIAISFPEVAEHFPNTQARIHATGYPVRAGLQQRSMSHAQAREHFRLAPDLFTLLVFGGSRGARAINQALAAQLPPLLEKMQIIHISGPLDYAQAQARAAHLSSEQQARYQLFPYLHDDLIAAMHAADLVVARAGAATLGEFPALGLPAILIPLPISGGHQRHNARYLAQRHAAIIIENSDMPTELLPALLDLHSHPQKLAAMSRASLALARPNAARDIAKILLNLQDRTLR